MNGFFSNTAFCLWIAACISAIAVMPYAVALNPERLHAAVERFGMSKLIMLSVAQSAVLLFIATFVGLWAAHKVGLSTPLLDRWLDGGHLPLGEWLRIAIVVIGLGLASGFIIIAVDRFIFRPAAPTDLIKQLPEPPSRWLGLLASFYGGIGEEVLLRLFLLSILALGLQYLLNIAGGGVSLSSSVFWTANIVAAILFGLGHLPATSAIMPLTPLVVVRALLLNGFVGVVAGYLFKRYGLETAMLYHFSADIALHVILPL